MTMIELASMRATKDIAVGEGPFALAFNGAGDRLFVADVRSGDVTVIDAVTETVAGKIAVGGAPYGATTIAGGDGSRQPSEIELAGARHQGELVARTATKLFG